MKAFAFLIPVAFGCANVLNAASTPEKLEQQFRADIEAWIRADWPRDHLRDDVVAKKVEEMTSDARRSLTSLFADFPRNELPSDVELRAAHVRLVAERGEEPRAPLFDFYSKLWRGKQLNPEQKILFLRSIQLLIDESATKRKRANKALEPTSTSVTPRASARVAPAALVAHL